MTQFGWIKLNDKPFIPDDKNVAQLFKSELLPIINLPGIVFLNSCLILFILKFLLDPCDLCVVTTLR
jgi:hypothetical protein